MDAHVTVPTEDDQAHISPGRRAFQSPAWRISLWWGVLLAAITLPCMFAFTSHDEAKAARTFSDATCDRVLYAQRAMFWGAEMLVVIYVAFASHRVWVRCAVGAVLIAGVYLLHLVEDGLVIPTYLSWDVAWPRTVYGVRNLAYQSFALALLRFLFGPIQNLPVTRRPLTLLHLFGLMTATAVLTSVALHDWTFEIEGHIEGLLRHVLVAAGFVLLVLGRNVVALALGVVALVAVSAMPTANYLTFPLPVYAATVGIPLLLLRRAGYRLQR
jgi:hypothetical protein